MESKPKARVIYGILMLFTAFLFVHSPAAAGRNIVLSISFDKEEYKKTDPVSLTFKLKNKDKKPVYINKRFYLNSKDAPERHREVYLCVISPSGKKLPCKSSYQTGLPKTDYFVLLKPGEEISPERKQNIKHLFDFEEAGEYKITAVYKNVHGKEIGIDVFKGRIKSKPVIIKIFE